MSQSDFAKHANSFRSNMKPSTSWDLQSSPEWFSQPAAAVERYLSTQYVGETLESVSVEGVQRASIDSISVRAQRDVVGMVLANKKKREQDGGAVMYRAYLRSLYQSHWMTTAMFVSRDGEFFTAQVTYSGDLCEYHDRVSAAFGAVCSVKSVQALV